MTAFVRGSTLALGVLVAFACARLSVFLTFHFAGIAGKQTGLLERRAWRFFGRSTCQSAGNSMTYRPRLATDPPTVYMHSGVIHRAKTSELQRLPHEFALERGPEVFVHGTSVDHNLSCAEA